MKRKTYTQYRDHAGETKIEARKLSAATLNKRLAASAYYMDIDQYAPSKGFFNKRRVEGV